MDTATASNAVVAVVGMYAKGVGDLELQLAQVKSELAAHEEGLARLGTFLEKKASTLAPGLQGLSLRTPDAVVIATIDLLRGLLDERVKQAEALAEGQRARRGLHETLIAVGGTTPESAPDMPPLGMLAAMVASLLVDRHAREKKLQGVLETTLERVGVPAASTPLRSLAELVGLVAKHGTKRRVLPKGTARFLAEARALAKHWREVDSWPIFANEFMQAEKEISG